MSQNRDIGTKKQSKSLKEKTMMNIFTAVSFLTLVSFVKGQELRRHRKEHYVLPELDLQVPETKLEDESDQLRQEVS